MGVADPFPNPGGLRYTISSEHVCVSALCCELVVINDSTATPTA